MSLHGNCNFTEEEHIRIFNVLDPMIHEAQEKKNITIKQKSLQNLLGLCQVVFQLEGELKEKGLLEKAVKDSCGVEAHIQALYSIPNIASYFSLYPQKSTRDLLSRLGLDKKLKSAKQRKKKFKIEDLENIKQWSQKEFSESHEIITKAIEKKVKPDITEQPQKPFLSFQEREKKLIKSKELNLEFSNIIEICSEAEQFPAKTFEAFTIASKKFAKGSDLNLEGVMTSEESKYLKSAFKHIFEGLNFTSIEKLLEEWKTAADEIGYFSDVLRTFIQKNMLEALELANEGLKQFNKLNFSSAQQNFEEARRLSNFDHLTRIFDKMIFCSSQAREGKEMMERGEHSGALLKLEEAFRKCPFEYDEIIYKMMNECKTKSEKTELKDYIKREEEERRLKETAVKTDQILKSIPSQIDNIANSISDREQLVKSLVDIQIPEGYNILVFNTGQSYSKDFSGVIADKTISKRFNLFFNIEFRIWIFKSGNFENKGDGGWINWGFKGKYDRNGKKIIFSG